MSECLRTDNNGGVWLHNLESVHIIYLEFPEGFYLKKALSFLNKHFKL